MNEEINKIKRLLEEALEHDNEQLIQLEAGILRMKGDHKNMMNSLMRNQDKLIMINQIINHK